MGISSSTEIFQKAMIHILEGLEGTECIMDDSLVWGRDQDEHDENAVKLLLKIRAQAE